VKTDVVAGGTFVWSSTWSVAVVVTPAPGTNWFLDQSQVIIPPNGSVTVSVPANTTQGSYSLNTMFYRNTGESPCTPQTDGSGGTVKVRNMN